MLDHEDSDSDDGNVVEGKSFAKKTTLKLSDIHPARVSLPKRGSFEWRYWNHYAHVVARESLLVD
jgi:hypothetical protein